MADPGCTGTQGTVTNFEELDKTYDYSTALVADVTGGGTLGQVLTKVDPDHMQRKLVNGVCQPAAGQARQPGREADPAKV